MQSRLSKHALLLLVSEPTYGNAEFNAILGVELAEGKVWMATIPLFRLMQFAARIVVGIRNGRQSTMTVGVLKEAWRKRRRNPNSRTD